MIPLAKPLLGEEEARAVAGVLSTGMLVQGTKVAALEERLAALCGRRYAVACASGTSALELALAALGVEAGAEVLCPDLSWPSPGHAIVRVGGRPRLVDVDPKTWNASAEALAAAQTERTRAAIVIDQFGNPADHAAIAEALDAPIVVDAACSLGATVAGRPAPSYGDVACLSFHPRKLITTGEGGACLTDDEGLAEQLRIHRNHGQRGPGDFAAPAGNHRMTDMEAAIGLVQLDRLPHILERRRALAAVYRERLSGVQLQEVVPGAQGNHQTLGVLLPDGVDRDGVVEQLRARGVQSGRLSYALHRAGSLPGLGDDAALPVASRVEDQGLALPLFPQLTDAEQATVIEAFEASL